LWNAEFSFSQEECINLFVVAEVFPATPFSTLDHSPLHRLQPSIYAFVCAAVGEKEEHTPKKACPKIEKSIQEVLNHTRNTSGRGRQMVLAALQQQKAETKPSESKSFVAKSCVQMIVQRVSFLQFRGSAVPLPHVFISYTC
jgi:hypothetical protein